MHCWSLGRTCNAFLMKMNALRRKRSTNAASLNRRRNRRARTSRSSWFFSDCRVAELAVTVANPKMVLATAVFEVNSMLWQQWIRKGSFLLLFLSAYQLKLQSPELVLSDTTVIKLWKHNKNCSSSKAFSFCYCQLGINHLLKWQYEKHFFASILSFYVALEVVKSKSKIRTVG